MGQTLSEPVTAKESSCVQNKDYKVGSSCMQGWRVTMEDAHTHILSVPDDKRAAFFGVYDGHGGSKVAVHAGNHLHKYIVQRPEYRAGEIAEAIKQGFMEFDDAMQRDELMRDELAGTTAITVLVKGGVLYCGNVGDSRAVASVAGHTEALSHDHKPNNPEESTRITRAGGWVEYNRVNGNLALSRALGDFVFKRNSGMNPDEQMVIAVPDIEVRHITEDWEFILLACDGIWDVITNAEAVEFIRRRLCNRMEPEAICEELMTSCLAPDCQMGGLGCDNMTCILVCLLHGKTFEELCQRVSQSMRVMPIQEPLRAEATNGDLESPPNDSSSSSSESIDEEDEENANRRARPRIETRAFARRRTPPPPPLPAPVVSELVQIPWILRQVNDPYDPNYVFVADDEEVVEENEVTVDENYSGDAPPFPIEYGGNINDVNDLRRG